MLASGAYNMTHSTEVREFAAADELTEGEIDKVGGGSESDQVCVGAAGLNRALNVWNHLVGQYGFPTMIS
jgi:hypothetical protein